MNFILMGLFVQVVLFFSVFDVYFKSPVIQGLSPIKNDVKPPAKRLVLIVADGLRADKFFDYTDNNTAAPYLRSIIENRGVWGVSTAHVPTESRPGHVSLIAGLYEDPTAVFKGWKDNPVNFDSVFNQSTHTFSWGSPDILPMFNKGSASSHVHAETYSSSDQEFFGTTKNASFLNLWVLNRFNSFLKESKTQGMEDEKLIYFLHLLTTDVVGHVDKPTSKDYIDSIVLTDQIVKEVEELISEHYKDNSTAFIFTSDHGMTDWGSHGAGSVSETDTPVVAWGAGISGPKSSNTNNGSPPNWSLSYLERYDINQSDTACLMSILLGVSIPVNSVGVLPYSLLKMSEIDIAKALYLNAKQIMAQYNWLKQTIRQYSLSIFFKDFVLNDNDLKLLHRSIEFLLDSESSFNIVVPLIQNLISHSLFGLDFYQNYYQIFLTVSVTSSFLGWALCILVYLLPNASIYLGKKPNRKMMKMVDMTYGAIMAISVLLVFVQSLRMSFYLYVCLPISLWWWASKKLCSMPYVLNFLWMNKGEVTKNVVMYGLGLQVLVYSFFYRTILSAIMVGLIFWPLFSSELRNFCHGYVLSWVSTCIFLSFFPFFPTVGFYQNIYLVCICCCCWIFGGTILLYSKIIPEISKNVIFFNVGVIVLSLLNLLSIEHHLDLNHGFLFSQILSWLILGVSLGVLYFRSNFIYSRFIEISMSLAAPYLLLSIGHEAFFTFFLGCHLLCWVSIEYEMVKSNLKEKFETVLISEKSEQNNHLTIGDLRRSYFFLLYIMFSFFGIGNIASINSFDVTWVRAFISVFSPFVMTGLILLKTLIPFLLVTVSFRFINVITKARAKLLFMVVLLLCNFMCLSFFYRITTKGSWLEIGTSISHYVIMQVTTVFLIGLYGIAKFITSGKDMKMYKTSLEEPFLMPFSLNSLKKVI